MDKQLSRKQFITHLAAGSSALAFSSFAWATDAASGRPPKSYYAFIPVSPGLLNPPLPPGTRSPFGWDYFEIPQHPEGRRFQATGLPNRHSGRIFLRLFIAMEIRVRHEIDVLLGDTDQQIGSLSVWYANSLQLFECELDTSLQELAQQGFTLKVTSDTGPVYAYVLKEHPGSHIYVENPSSKPATATHYLSTLPSLWTMQPFGWMEGCLLDGLQALAHARKSSAIRAHIRQRLSLFLPDEQHIRYESYHGLPIDNEVKNWEAGLPFATIAKEFPNHASIRLFTDFCEQRIENGITTGSNLTAEGCYHLAFPLATIGGYTKKKEWIDIALIELTERIALLQQGDVLYQRAYKKKDHVEFRNWARGYAWYLMGLVRSYRVIHATGSFKGDPRVSLLKDAFEFCANNVLKHQLAEGGWRAYVDLPETGFDASGTSGIASALKYAHEMRWNVAFDKSARQRVRSRLEQSLTADGFLKDSTQVNRGGDELQKSDYRVIAQYAMGLMAHLYT